MSTHHKYPQSTINLSQYYGEKVYIYYNCIHKIFSIKANDKPLSHAYTCGLKNITFSINNSSRNLPPKRGCKILHPYAIGELQYIHYSPIQEIMIDKLKSLGYKEINYKIGKNTPNFYYLNTKKYTPITSATFGVFSNKRAFII